MQGMNKTESDEQRLADELDARGPFIETPELHEILVSETHHGATYHYACGVLAARAAS